MERLLRIEDEDLTVGNFLVTCGYSFRVAYRQLISQEMVNISEIFSKMVRMLTLLTIATNYTLPFHNQQIHEYVNHIKLTKQFLVYCIKIGSTKELKHKANNAHKWIPSGEISVNTGLCIHLISKHVQNTATHLRINKQMYMVMRKRYRWKKQEELYWEPENLSGYSYLYVILALSDIVTICYYQTNYYPSDPTNYIGALVAVV